MHGRWWAGWLLGLALGLGCSRPLAEPLNSGRKSVARADVELRVESVERTEAGLVLTYAVHNRGTQVLWLLDQLFERGPTGSVRLAPDKAYVEVRGAQVLVSRMLHPVPDTLLVEAPEVPAVTRVDPGQTVSRRAVLPVPLSTSLPYPSGPKEEVSLEDVRELRLRIGYLVDEPGLELHAARDSEGNAWTSPSYGKAVTAQKVLESGPLRP
jgi:hypothetical protein